MLFHTGLALFHVSFLQGVCDFKMLNDRLFSPFPISMKGIEPADFNLLIEAF